MENNTEITQVTARIMTVMEIMADTFLLRLHTPEIAAAARPGQFIMVRCGGTTVLPTSLLTPRG
jgi:dihydroorotate dehydrogenase electron transfer subunit